MKRKTYSLSNIYPHQSAFLNPIEKTNLIKWNQDFPKPDMITHLLERYTNIKRIMASKDWRETHYKVLHRANSTVWYPDTTHRNRKTPSRCPKCQQENFTLIHCFWTCTTIQRFWTDTMAYIKEVTKLEIQQDPHLCILNIHPKRQNYKHRTKQTSSTSSYHTNEWTQLCLLTANRCLTRQWIH